MAWYETFFEQYYLQGFAVFTTPEMTQRQVDFMVKTLRLPPHSRILDLGCGADAIVWLWGAWVSGGGLRPLRDVVDGGAPRS